MIKVFFIFSIFIIPGLPHAAGDPIAGRSASIICIGCHTRDGNSTNPEYPILAGQDADYLAKQLTDFKSGRRVEEHMTAMVEAISERDIPNLAAYFSQQRRKPGTQSKDHSTLGKQIFTYGIAKQGVKACSSCHGDKANGRPAMQYPSLAGQHASYLSKSLNDYRSDKRQNDAGKVMRRIAKKLSPEAILSLSRYLSQLE